LNDRAMEIASVLLRLGALRRDDSDHQVIYEELGKDAILCETVRSRLAAVGYDLVDDLGHLGVRVSSTAEAMYPTRNRMGLTAAHIRMIVYLWTQLVYRELVNLRRGLSAAAPGHLDLFDKSDESPFVSYRAVWNDFSQRMPASHIKSALSTLKRHRFVRYDEKRDRIWADASLYTLVDRARMEDFVVDLARRLGTEDVGDAVARVVVGSQPVERDPEDGSQ
jgi:hypothetical protein